MALIHQLNNTSDSGNERSSFLRLPPEIRGMIYHLHLTSERMVPLHTYGRWAPIDLLYNEAFFHLYSRGGFVLELRPHSIPGLDTRLRTKAHSASQRFEIFAPSTKLSQLIRYITLDIHWLSNEYRRYNESRNGPSSCKMLKQAMVPHRHLALASSSTTYHRHIMGLHDDFPVGAAKIRTAQV